MSDQLLLWPQDEGDGLRWSISRDKRLRDCHRKYWLFHFGSRGGQLPGAPRDKRELFVLRSLRTRYMWVGEVVHQLIELALGAWRRGEEAPVDALVERGTRTMRAHYAESVQGVYWDKPMRALGLVEHEYNEAIAREEWRAQRDKMERCIRNFFALDLVQQIRRTPMWRWLAVESLGSFELEGATIVVRPDFAWRDEQDRIVLVDWKTGMPREEDEDLQLGVYGIFARRAWGSDADHCRATNVYLANGEVREQSIGAAHLEAAERAIRASLESMRQLAGASETPDIAAFPMTDDTSTCSRCGFRRACGR
jgi:hypothetical protein